MIGGVGSFFGPIWGMAIFQILEELILRFTDRVELVTGRDLDPGRHVCSPGTCRLYQDAEDAVFFDGPAASAKMEKTS